MRLWVMATAYIALLPYPLLPYSLLPYSLTPYSLLPTPSPHIFLLIASQDVIH
jgi:hypothetical protein